MSWGRLLYWHFFDNLSKIMNFHIITLFPGAFDSYIGESIIARAIREKKISIKFYNPRDFVPKSDRTGKDKNYAPVDNKPYGGGPGMVMEALPVAKAIAKAKGTKRNVRIIFLSPSGTKFTTEIARSYAEAKKNKKPKDLIIVCGRYEGIDARVKKIFKTEEISVGDYVLTGGELPAMVILDCVSRQIEGVLGNFDSREESRIASADSYTRPEILEYKGKKYRVPKVLLSGNRALIDKWRAGEDIPNK